MPTIAVAPAPPRRPVATVALAGGRELELHIAGDVLQLVVDGAAEISVPLFRIPELGAAVSKACAEATWRSLQARPELAPLTCPRCGDAPAELDAGDGRRLCVDCLWDLQLLAQDNRPDLEPGGAQ